MLSSGSQPEHGSSDPTGAAHVPLSLSLLAANIWFPAMIHGGALPAPPPSSTAMIGDGMVCGKGKNSPVSVGGSWKVLQQARAMFRSRWRGAGCGHFAKRVERWREEEEDEMVTWT